MFRKIVSAGPLRVSQMGLLQIPWNRDGFKSFACAGNLMSINRHSVGLEHWQFSENPLRPENIAGWRSDNGSGTADIHFNQIIGLENITCDHWGDIMAYDCTPGRTESEIRKAEGAPKGDVGEITRAFAVTQNGICTMVQDSYSLQATILQWGENAARFTRNLSTMPRAEDGGEDYCRFAEILFEDDGEIYSFAQHRGSGVFWEQVGLEPQKPGRINFAWTSGGFESALRPLAFARWPGQPMALIILGEFIHRDHGQDAMIGVPRMALHYDLQKKKQIGAPFALEKAGLGNPIQYRQSMFTQAAPEYFALAFEHGLACLSVQPPIMVLGSTPYDFYGKTPHQLVSTALGLRLGIDRGAFVDYAYVAEAWGQGTKVSHPIEVISISNVPGAIRTRGL